MIKKDYLTPEVRIEKFTLCDIVTVSQGIGDGDNTTDPIDPDDEF